MLQSLYQITFIPDNDAASVLLLDFGDRLDKAPEFPVSAQADAYAPIGSTFGIAIPKWGARRAFSWSVRRDHASHAAAASFTLSHPASLPYMSTGKFRIAIQGGDTWDFYDGVISGCASSLALSRGFTTLTSYRAESGKSLLYIFYALTTSATHGSITGSTSPYLNGSIAVLTAVPASGYSFSGWSGSVTSTDNPLSLTMDSAKTITANFTVAQYWEDLTTNWEDLTTNWEVFG